MLLILFLKIYRIKKTINGDIIIPAVILLILNKNTKMILLKMLFLILYQLKDLKIAPEINKIKDKFNRLYDGVNKFSK